jgi:spore cortex formation protein SpoVR/YcgB (stage V sporulation)
MNFSNVSKEQKLQIYNKRINVIEHEIFSKVLEIGMDPDFFDLNEFINSFESVDKSVDNYHTQVIINDSAISYLSIKNKINLLEKEEDGI